jgi:dephospho-CoA kinase
VTQKTTVIGLTGGVASGKSSVASLLAAAGVTVLDLDRIGRELTDNDPQVIQAIAALCGPEVAPDGRLDRAKVREAIFADADKRKRLEALLHPLIWAEFLRRKDEAARAGAKLVICEAALLAETGIDKKLDGLVVVTAHEPLREERIVRRDNISAELAGKMIRAQLREPPAHGSLIVIENHGSLAELAIQVGKLIDGWRARGLL